MMFSAILSSLVGSIGLRFQCLLLAIVMSRIGLESQNSNCIYRELKRNSRCQLVNRSLQVRKSSCLFVFVFVVVVVVVVVVVLFFVLTLSHMVSMVTVNNSQRQLSSSWSCKFLSGQVSQLVTVFLENGSKDFLDFLHEVTHR